MRGMKGKLMKKLKSSKSIGYLNPNQILHVANFDGFVDNFNLKSTFVDNFPFKSHSKSHCSPQRNPKSTSKPVKIDVEELKDQEINFENNVDDKENVSVLVYEEDSFCTVDLTETLKNEPLAEIDILKPKLKPEKINVEEDKENVSVFVYEEGALCEVDETDIDILTFRRPDMESDMLFDPRLLSAFRKAVLRHVRACEEAATNVKTCEQKPKYPFFQHEDVPEPSSNSDDQTDPLTEFDEKCPPGGMDSVIFYTTSLRGIRKTFEDCQSIRFLLQSFGVIFYERDVSVHTEYRDELWRVMGEKSLPPRLFIRGRYIGGADKVLTLNEQGKLRPLFRDIPIDFSEGPCRVCCGLRFMLCYNCDGSRKVFKDDDHGGGGGGNGGVWTKCLECNENGLVVCPLC
ncbi:hypothetical protein RND81_04G047200 [Saponaria officinalis]|uniref:Glutaredoxin domain-containing protein n=1 Tax=Saponaria officinalis TaxID=3572 RepID=A0AAW1LCL6_SAPOF